MILDNLKNLYATLNQVEVKGEQNISYMWASLSILKDAISTLQEASASDKEEE